MNEWEEALRSEDYAKAMASFELGIALLPTFIEDAKAWSKTHSFEVTAIRGLEETAFLYAMTNNRGKLGWLREIFEKDSDLRKFLPGIDSAMQSRNDAEKILELCSRDGGFLQINLKNEIKHPEPGYLVSYLSRFGLIRKVKEGRSNRLFREHVRPSWCYWPLPK